MRKNMFFLVCAILFVNLGALEACTLWGAVGADVSGGGTIVAKTRDEEPNHTQIIKVFRPEKGYAYLALFVAVKDSNTLSFRNVVNEKGLSAVMATAGSIPAEMRTPQGKRDVLPEVITACANCDEVLARASEFFPHCNPRLIMFADNKKIVLAQVALDGKYKFKIVDKGTIAQTNHFLDDELKVFNTCTGGGNDSSVVRVARMTELLRECDSPFTIEKFKTMAFDQSAGANNSIFRIGTPWRTLATWIVETPPQGAPRIRIDMTSPIQLPRTLMLTLDKKFWDETNGEIW